MRFAHQPAAWPAGGGEEAVLARLLSHLGALILDRIHWPLSVPFARLISSVLIGHFPKREARPQEAGSGEAADYPRAAFRVKALRARRLLKPGLSV